MKFVMIESDLSVVRDVEFCLRVRYPDVTIVSTGQSSKAPDIIENDSPDLLLLASSLAGTDVINLIAKIRTYSDVPMIILCDSKSEMDVARFLEAGADDSIRKPCSPMELLSRVKALLRRTRGLSVKSERSISFGGQLSINFDSHEVLLSGTRVKLTPLEYQILSELVRNEGRVITNRDLLEKAWGSEYVNDFSYIKKYIYRLRSKLEPGVSNPQMLVNERGTGYKFVRPAV